MLYGGLGDSTLIKIYDSSLGCISIREIYYRYKTNKETFIFSFDRDLGIPVKRKVSKAYDNRMQDVCRVYLTNEKNFDCTITHRLLLYHRDCIPISYLRIMDELLEFDPKETIEISSIVPLGMRHVYNIQIDGDDNFALEAGIYSSN